MQPIVVIALLAIAVGGLVWQWPVRVQAETGPNGALGNAERSTVPSSFLDRHGNLLRQVAVLIASAALTFVTANTLIAIWTAIATWIGDPVGLSAGWVTILAAALVVGVAYWRRRARLLKRAPALHGEPDISPSNDQAAQPQGITRTSPATNWWPAIVTVGLAAAIVLGAAKLNSQAFGTVLSWASTALPGRNISPRSVGQRGGALEPASGSATAASAPSAMTLHPAFYVEEFLASAHDARKALDEIDNRLVASVKDYQSRGLDGLARSAQAGIESNRQAVVQHRAQARTALQLIVIAMAQDRAGTTHSIAEYSATVLSYDPGAKPLLDVAASAGVRTGPDFVMAAMEAWERAVADTPMRLPINTSAGSAAQPAGPEADASPNSARASGPTSQASSSLRASDSRRTQPRAEPQRPSRQPGSALDRERYRRMELPPEEYQR